MLSLYVISKTTRLTFRSATVSHIWRYIYFVQQNKRCTVFQFWLGFVRGAVDSPAFTAATAYIYPPVCLHDVRNEKFTLRVTAYISQPGHWNVVFSHTMFKKIRPDVLGMFHEHIHMDSGADDAKSASQGCELTVSSSTIAQLSRLCTSLNRRVITNHELGRMWKVVACCKAIPRLLGRTRRNYGKKTELGVAGLSWA